jgi:hypothetical protein
MVVEIFYLSTIEMKTENLYFGTLFCLAEMDIKSQSFGMPKTEG